MDIDDLPMTKLFVESHEKPKKKTEKRFAPYWLETLDEKLIVKFCVSVVELEKITNPKELSKRCDESSLLGVMVRLWSVIFNTYKIKGEKIIDLKNCQNVASCYGERFGTISDHDLLDVLFLSDVIYGYENDLDFLKLNAVNHSKAIEQFISAVDFEVSRRGLVKAENKELSFSGMKDIMINFNDGEMIFVDRKEAVSDAAFTTGKIVEMMVNGEVNGEVNG